MVTITLITACSVMTSCGGSDGDTFSISSPLSKDKPGSYFKAPVYSYQVINTYPHQRDAFTEGLVYSNGRLYESNGLVGQSNLRELDLVSGHVIREVQNSGSQFSEGLALRLGKLYQLDLDQGQAQVWSLDSFNKIQTLNVPVPAWGLTYLPSKDRFVMSDGTSKLSFLTPASFHTESQLEVTDNGQPINNLNELEYANDMLFANIFMSDQILAIDPRSGVVLFRVNLAGIIDKAANGLTAEDVLNGIAYDPLGERLFVTGKRWPFLYEIQIISDPLTP